MPDWMGEASKISRLVCMGEKRKYYRFRVSGYYGGIATADCVGCNLKCFYCWSSSVRDKPHLQYLGYLAPGEVAERLASMVASSGVKLVRLSGNEPLLCPEHTLKVIEHFSTIRPHRVYFVLETNGLLFTPELAEKLAEYRSFLHVRISLKGTSPAAFKIVTGMDGGGFEKQLSAVRLLYKVGLSCTAAVMDKTVTKRSLRLIRSIVRRLNPQCLFEVEEYQQFGRPIPEALFERVREAGEYGIHV